MTKGFRVSTLINITATNDVAIVQSRHSACGDAVDEFPLQTLTGLCRAKICSPEMRQFVLTAVESLLEQRGIIFFINE